MNIKKSIKPKTLNSKTSLMSKLLVSIDDNCTVYAEMGAVFLPLMISRSKDETVRAAEELSARLSLPVEHTLNRSVHMTIKKFVSLDGVFGLVKRETVKFDSVYTASLSLRTLGASPELGEFIYSHGKETYVTGSQDCIVNGAIERLLEGGLARQDWNEGCPRCLTQYVTTKEAGGYFCLDCGHEQSA